MQFRHLNDYSFDIHRFGTYPIGSTGDKLISKWFNLISAIL